MKVFHAFRLDVVNRCLWRADERLLLTPKAFDVLRYLVDHRDRLVTQDEILEAVWAETHVNPEVVKKSILEIRKTLGDRPGHPVFIETLRKRGYQFIAPVRDERIAGAAESEIDSNGKIVGREAALARLESHLERASGGRRQVVFVTGEAGIGKTRLVDNFLERVARQADSRRIRGHCIEGFGGKEPYYPLLEALGQLARGGSESFIQVFAKTAPGWLLQFPSLVKPEQRELLHKEILGTTPARMVRELCEAFEAITARIPLLLVLEDLHWADPSTVDVISALARRREPSKFLLIGTYRPYEILDSTHPLRTLTQDLLIHNLCDDLPVQPLDPAQIGEYLARTFPDHRLPSGLSGLIHRQSGGNALFMSALVEDLVKRSTIVQQDGYWRLSDLPENIPTRVPETLEQMLRAQFERLGDAEQRILACGSVVGERFSVWAVSAMTADAPDLVEAACDELADRNLFIRPAGIQAVADGSLSAHYEFRHSLYRQALYRRLSNLNRSKLHKSLGERLRDVHREFSLDSASELALHFEEAREYLEAVKYLMATAEHAGSRFAHRDAIQVLRHALELLGKIGGRPQTTLGIAILRRIADSSYALGAMSDSVAAYEQAVAAAAEAGEKALQIECLISLAGPACYCDVNHGLDVCARAVELSRSFGDPLLLAQAQMAAATCRLLYAAWRKEDSFIYEAAVADVRSLAPSSAPTHYQVLSVYVRAAQGDYHGALEAADSAIRQMAGCASPTGYLLALGAKAVSLLHLGRFGEVLRIVRAGQETAKKNDMDPWIFIFREAWLRALCFDFEGVRKLGAVRMRSDSEQHAAQPRTIALVAAGHAEMDRRNYGSALRYFARVTDSAAPKFFLHWHWRIQAQLGAAAAWLQSGNIPKAVAEAARCLESALATAAPNLRALAWEISARTAFADGDIEGARQSLRNALAIVEQFDVPLAAWRVHGAAWELYPGEADAERHRDIARNLVSTIANSFDDEEPLKTCLLSAVSVRQLFGPLRRGA
jgi:DNA-binding winged helix-turn-helix (wHTH) protein/tetratricopeptide (TPR) repeat protein